MLNRDGAAPDRETDDPFPVRDIETGSKKLVIPRSKERGNFSKEPTKDFPKENHEFSFELEGLTLPEIGEKLFVLLKAWYHKACLEARDAVQDIRNVWTTSSGSHAEKTKAVSRLFMYYLIILALYIIKNCLWVDQKLFMGLYKMILNSDRNTQTVIGLGIVLSLILAAFVIGAPYCPEP